MKWKNRKNGFTKPLNALQIISWTIFILNCAYFGLFIATMNHWIIAIILSVTYSFISIMVARYALLAMLKDPIDDIVAKERKCRAENIAFK